MSLFKLRWLVLIGLSHLLAVSGSGNENIRPVGRVNLAGAETVTGQTEAVKAEGASDEEGDTGGTDSQAVVPNNQRKQVASSPVEAKAEEKKAAKSIASSGNRAPTGANRFNRLMQPPSQRNPPPAKDGIHDPENPGTHILQPPKEAFSSMPKGSGGNRVDWVAALEKGQIAPRFDLHDPDKEPMMLDLDIVREVKGTMPDVVYPHKQHTEWLDCSNCHPGIFIPQKGANDISMAAILLGEKCGVCHGKVAFPVSDCRKCHSRRKEKP
jgi:c(7)-type cytochrome triheme protein